MKKVVLALALVLSLAATSAFAAPAAVGNGFTISTGSVVTK